MLMNKMYAVRVSGFKDPRNWLRWGVLLLAVAALGLCALFWPGPGRLESVLAGLAALLAAYAFVWPVLRGIDVDTALFLGRTWRFDLGRIAAWTFLLAGGMGIIRTFSLLKSAGGTGRAANFVLMHRTAVALACLGLSCLAFAVHLLW
jgi:hypothetical protein